MLSLTQSPRLSVQLREQLVETERRIADLIALRDGLFRTLLRVDKVKTKAPQEDIRSNSHDRLLIERKVLESLKIADGRALSTRKLFGEAHAACPKLRYSTFRSHLSRLKKRGMIASKKDDRGYWMLPDAAPGVRRPVAMAS